MDTKMSQTVTDVLASAARSAEARVVRAKAHLECFLALGEDPTFARASLARAINRLASLRGGQA